MSKTVMYSQLQPWSSVGAPPCVEQVSGAPIPPRIGSYFTKTPRPHPWRPIMGFEAIEINTLPEVPITNRFMSPQYVPEGMSTEALKFPNFVTGFDRNPQHAARAALYTRYTYPEWLKSTKSLLTESNSTRNQGDFLRANAMTLMRSTDEETMKGQIDSGRRIGQRISELRFWRNEVQQELDRLLSLNIGLADTKRNIQKALVDLETPLHIAQECLYHREQRKGTELVHDDIEQSLLYEIETIRTSQKRLNEMLEKVNKQFRDSRAAQALLEEDVACKESALGIDSACHQLNNFSRGINYYGGIEKYDPTTCDLKTWASASEARVKR